MWLLVPLHGHKLVIIAIQPDRGSGDFRQHRTFGIPNPFDQRVAVSIIDEIR